MSEVRLTVTEVGAKYVFEDGTEVEFYNLTNEEVRSLAQAGVCPDGAITFDCCMKGVSRENVAKQLEVYLPLLRKQPEQSKVGFQIMCNSCGSMMEVIDKKKSSESIEVWYDLSASEIVVKCTGCQQEAYL